MANKSVFNKKNLAKKNSTKRIPVTNTVNNAGGIAYSKNAESELAQLIVTETFASTFYKSADSQLTQFVTAANKVPTTFLAKAAIYASQLGYMKDAPIMALALLSTLDKELFQAIFSRIITNESKLRTFVQIMRSGTANGRKSLGSLPKSLVNKWLEARPADRIFKGSIGNDPSLADVIKMTHPDTADIVHRALYAYLVNGKPHSATNPRGYIRKDLPKIVREYEAFKEDQSEPIPNLDFRMFSSMNLKKEHWVNIAKAAGVKGLLKNLNNFGKHGVFDDQSVVDHVVNLLSDGTAIRMGKIMPHEVLQAIDMSQGLKTEMKEALEIALDHTLINIPDFNCNILVAPDVSGSMRSAVTGNRGTATSEVTNEKVAALISAALLRKNLGQTHIVAFDTVAHPINANNGESIAKISQKIYGKFGGGTDVSIPFQYIQAKKLDVDLIYIISDNESWFSRINYSRGTSAVNEWKKVDNGKRKVVCQDISPNTTFQLCDSTKILNIGGFSDNLFNVVKTFVEGNSDNPWTDAINSIVI